MSLPGRANRLVPLSQDVPVGLLEQADLGAEAGDLAVMLVILLLPYHDIVGGRGVGGCLGICGGSGKGNGGRAIQIRR